MDTNLQNYFLSLQPDNNPSVIELSPTYKNSFKPLHLNYRTKMGIIKISGRKFYVKPTKFFSFDEITEQNIASAKMYQHLNITTPTVYPAIITFLNQKYNTITESVPSDHSSIIIKPAASTSIENLSLYKLENYKQNKWNILTHGWYKQMMLEYMTPRCYEQLMQAFILGELRTDGDLHTNNFFLYKTTPQNKYEGIIVIDLEECNILDSKLQRPDTASKEGFDAFVKNVTLLSYTPNQHFDTLTHEERIIMLKSFLSQGKASSFHHFVRDALNFDFPSEVAKAHKQCNNIPPSSMYYTHPYSSKSYDAISRLWEYNREMLLPELEL